MPSVSLNIARHCPLLAALLCGTQLSFAQLPAARLSTISPPGGKAGTTVEVTVTGSQALSGGRVVFADGKSVALQPSGDRMVTGRVTVDRSTTFRGASTWSCSWCRPAWWFG